MIVMALHIELDNTQQLVVTLEIVQEDMYDTDPTLLDAIKRDAVSALEEDGYTVKPPNTANRTRDGGIILEIIKTLSEVANNAWTNKGIAEEVLNDLGTLITIFGGVIPIAKHVLQAHEKRVGKQENLQQPFKITIEIDSASIVVEAPNLEDAEAILKIAQQFKSRHPVVAAKATLRSKVKVKDHVAKKPTHRRR